MIIEKAIEKCKVYIMTGLAGEEVARMFGNKDREEMFQNRTECIQDILTILEEE